MQLLAWGQGELWGGVCCWDSLMYPKLRRVTAPPKRVRLACFEMCFVGFSFFVGGLHCRACIRRMIG